MEEAERDREQGSGADRFQKMTRGRSADDATRRLLRAVLHGNTHDVKEALQDGGRPEEGVPDGDALMLAAGLGNADVVDLLLEAGASVVATGVDGHTALSMSAESGSSTVAQRLIDAGVRVSARWSKGNTPLHRFVTCANPEGSTESAWFRCLVECHAQQVISGVRTYRSVVNEVRRDV